MSCLLGNLWKFLGAFLLVPYHKNIIEWMPLNSGLCPPFHFRTQTFFSYSPNCFSFSNFPNVPESTLKWVQMTIKLYCGGDFRLHVFSPQEEIYGLK